MPKLYFISGLGADSRAFSLIDRFEGYENVFLEWLPPSHSKETIEAYTLRLIQNHNISKDDVIIGLSFGGLVAQEIAKTTPCKTIIFISSFRDKRDLKTFLQFLLKLKLYKILPNFRMNWFDKFAVQFFSIKSKEGKEGLLDMMKKTDPKLMKWSMCHLNSYNHYQPTKSNIYNIIGTKDKLLKQWRFNENNYVIKNAGHLMVYENAEEVNQLLKRILKIINS